ncbi:MAG: DUF3488 domain-containing protein, partial [Bdellovibrionales bacterium]|nr:DUF3488 domain-containing protein [Bdellovibrionales bacterium]
MSRKHMLYVYGIVAFNILPHIADLPFWIIASCFAILGWRILADFKFIKAPSSKVIIVIAAAFTVLIIQRFGSFMGGEASAATLLVMATLKTFEIRSYRDMMILTYLCFFLLMSKLIASQSLAMFVYMV